MTNRVLLVENHRIIREGLKTLIELSGEFRVVAEAELGAEALDLFKSLRPELVVIGVGSPAIHGVEAAKQIHHHSAEARVVMLSLGTDEDAMVHGLQCGVRGIVLKQDSSQDLLEALRVVAGGGSYFSAQISGRSYEPLSPQPLNATETGPVTKRLTNREREVLRLITLGKTSKEVADRLTLSVETVRSYRKSLMRKLGVRNIASLIHVAFEEGMTQWTKAGSSSYT
jgi:DNA-binding NarL/FixJ family response regulator